MPSTNPEAAKTAPPAVAPEGHARPALAIGSVLAPGSALVLAAGIGLVGGYLDLVMIVLKRDVGHAGFYYEQSRHFRWTVPLANLAVMMVPGLLVAVVNRLRPGRISPRSAIWLFATLAIWMPLLRAPLYGAATLLVAAGLARWISRIAAGHPRATRRLARVGLVAGLVLLSATAIVSLRRQALAESQALARLPAAPAGAGNVILIVMDTVRAESLGLYGYRRDTSPELARWAKRGVRFDWAMAPAPWTFPSHGSFLTGRWPSELNAHWTPILDPTAPTLAGFLASRGVVTAGFAANTHWCSYESGMDRGFVHYEDYPLTWRTILGSTVPGAWLLSNLRAPGDYYALKWIKSQSRGAREVNGALLDWLARRRPAGRPFFAFLNYLDAHEPFLAPPGESGRFGLRPESAEDSRMLLEYWDRDKFTLKARDVELARDAYDDCIAALDRQVGALLDELERRGVLRDTHVIITSDHGEEFGEHGIFNHGFSLYAPEVHVPLLIVSPEAPAGRTIAESVSLRDLPATILDLLSLGRGAPLPGRSLAGSWRAAGTPRGPALSEVYIPAVIAPQRGRGPNQRELTFSLVADGLHYLLDVRGSEELYDLAADPLELQNLKDAPGRYAALRRFRLAIRKVLAEDRLTGRVAEDYQRRFEALLESLIPAPAF
jgi:arylsulfatase A-like enzyme